MLKIGKEQKAGVISGLVASILFIYFLQPILNWISRIVVRVMTLAGSAFIDKIYTQAASLQTQNYSFLWLLFVFGTLSTLFFLRGILILFGEERIEPLLSKIRSKARSKNNILVRVSLSILHMSFAFLFLAVVSANFIQLKVIVTFQQQMRALAPYIDDAEEEQIYSRWSLMRTQADYEVISNTIEMHAKNNHLTLPESALYTATTL